MNRLSIKSNDWINQAVSVLKAGGLIIYPTETSYGLGADATNPVAIDRLLAYKGNRLGKALSIAIANRSMAEQYLTFNPQADNVFCTLLPGPVTLIAASTGQVAPKVESHRHTLGIRYSSHPLVNQLVTAFGRPITATSANTSGAKQIYSFADWQRYVPASRQPMIAVFLDAGKLPVRPPSTVIDTTLNNPQILRQGEIVFDHIAETFVSNSTQETVDYGAELITRHLDLLESKAIILALEGDLGAGKTHFAKGVATALGISDTVKSPTYTIMREYPFIHPKVSGTLYHVDTWRLFDTESLDDLHLKQALKPGTIIIIEWQQKAHQWLKNVTAVAKVAYLKIETLAETKRKFTLKWA